jgi:hypothetical protein
VNLFNPHNLYIKRAPAVGRPFELLVMLPPLKRIDRMKDTTLLDIAVKINEVAKADGVYAEVNFNPIPIRSQPSEMKTWDIELTYNNYHRIERFNNSMPIDGFEVDRIASILLKDLFADYFNAKLGLVT